LSSIKLKNLLNHFIIIILIFIIDRVSKVYLLNLHENGIDVDFYIFPFLNIYLAWNTGIGFGLFSTDPNIFYHFLTALIGMINLVLIILLFNLNGIRKYFISMILGGSFGNFFDRIYYFAVAVHSEIFLIEFTILLYPILWICISEIFIGSYSILQIYSLQSV